MGLFNRLFRGRAAAEQMSLALPKWKGSPRWSAISSAAAQAAAEAIRVAGGGSYMDVISSMRQGYEQGRRSNAWRGQDINDVLQMLARRATGAPPARAGYDTVDDLLAMKMFESETWQGSPEWKPVMSGKSALTEPGTRLRARQGAAKYRAWVRGHRPHIEAAAAAAGIGMRDATSRAWSAYKANPVPAQHVPSLIRAAIVGGRMESSMSTVKKPTSAVWKRYFGGKGTAADKKAVAAYNASRRSKPKKASSKKKASGSRKTMNFPANICTPAGRVRKPTSAMYKRYFAKKATAAEKRHVIAYNAWKRAGSPPANTKAGLSKKTAASKKKASSSKRKASSSKRSTSARKPASSGRKPSKAVWKRYFGGKGTAADKKAVAAYNAKRRAAKAGKTSAPKKPKSKRKSSAKPAPVRKAKSAAAAAATVVKAAKSGKPLASAKTMNRKAFLAKYGAEIKKGIGATKGVNYFSAAKIAHEAFDRAPQGQKTKAIGVAIKLAKKSGVFKKAKASAPKKKKTSAPKKKASSRRASGSQRFKVAGSVTVTAA